MRHAAGFGTRTAAAGVRLPTKKGQACRATREPNNETTPFLAGHWAKKAEDTKRIQPQIAYGLMGIDSPAVEFK
jgi:hypothetical protein